MHQIKFPKRNTEALALAPVNVKNTWVLFAIKQTQFARKIDLYNLFKLQLNRIEIDLDDKYLTFLYFYIYRCQSNTLYFDSSSGQCGNNINLNFNEFTLISLVKY